MVRVVSRLALALVTRSRSRPVTDWLTARLPAESNTMTRSPGISKKVIFRKVLTWSTPALVRESDRNTRPSSTWTPTQYVIESPGGPGQLYDVESTPA